MRGNPCYLKAYQCVSQFFAGDGCSLSEKVLGDGHAHSDDMASPGALLNAGVVHADAAGQPGHHRGWRVRQRRPDVDQRRHPHVPATHRLPVVPARATQSGDDRLRRGLLHR